jgi:hypothetical protein
MSQSTNINNHLPYSYTDYFNWVLNSSSPEDYSAKMQSIIQRNIATV